MSIRKLIALLVSVGLLLAGCSGGSFLPERKAAPPIPTYPNAQNVVTQPEPDESETTTYDTADPPATVIAFYDKQLPKQQRNGWRLFSKEQPQYIAQGCPYSFFVTLKAVRTSQGMTQVTLFIHKAPWCH